MVRESKCLCVMVGGGGGRVCLKGYFIITMKLLSEEMTFKLRPKREKETGM